MFADDVLPIDKLKLIRSAWLLACLLFLNPPLCDYSRDSTDMHTSMEFYDG